MKRSVVTSYALLFTILTLANSGCFYGPRPYYGQSPYGGYGANPYGTYPGSPSPYQAAPFNTLSPGQQYVPEGSVLPQGVTPTYQNPGRLTPVPDSGSSSAPPHSSSEINRSVPNPTNSNGSQYYETNANEEFQTPISANPIQPATLNAEPIRPIHNGLRESNAGAFPETNTNVYSPPAGTTAHRPGPANGPMTDAIDLSPTSATNFPADPAIGAQPNPFATPAPIPSSPALAPEGVESAPPQMPTEGLFENMSNVRRYKPVNDDRTFGHDPQYRWLRGVVSRDQPTGTWSVIYSDNPQQSDEYAGHLSLANSPFLQGLSDGDVVEVRGEVDPILKDPIGKPFYLITRLKTVTPAPQVGQGS